MNKKGKTEYNSNIRHANKRRGKPVDLNVVHDMEYTFADEYYKGLQDEYYETLLKEFKDSDD